VTSLLCIIYSENREFYVKARWYSALLAVVTVCVVPTTSLWCDLCLFTERMMRRSVWEKWMREWVWWWCAMCTRHIHCIHAFEGLTVWAAMLKCAKPTKLLLLVLNKLTLDEQWDSSWVQSFLHAYIQISATKMQIHRT
jgi:hypothetical protein